MCGESVTVLAIDAKDLGKAEAVKHVKEVLAFEIGVGQGERGLNGHHPEFATPMLPQCCRIVLSAPRRKRRTWSDNGQSQLRNIASLRSAHIHPTPSRSSSFKVFCAYFLRRCAPSRNSPSRLRRMQRRASHSSRLSCSRAVQRRLTLLTRAGSSAASSVAQLLAATLRLSKPSDSTCRSSTRARR